MKSAIARLWWQIRLWALQFRASRFACNEGQAILQLGFEAARRHDFAGFFRAVDLAGGLSRWGAETLAWAALPYYDSGRTQEASSLVTAALEKEPNNAHILACYGMYLQKEKRFQESIGYLEKALAIRREDPWILSRLGDAYRCLGMWEQAREPYLKALNQKPDEVETGLIYNGLAHIAAQLGDWREAERSWQEAAARRPMDEETWYNLGDALLHVGDYRGALRALKKNLRLGSKQPSWSFYDMASCYYSLGDISRARLFCDKTLGLSPDDEDAQEMKKELEKLQV